MLIAGTVFTSFISVHWITPWARLGGTSGEFHIHPPAQTRVRQSRLVSPRMENPKSLWKTCSRFGCPHSEKGGFFSFKWTFLHFRLLRLPPILSLHTTEKDLAPSSFLPLSGIYTLLQCSQLLSARDKLEGKKKISGISVALASSCSIDLFSFLWNNFT